MNSKLLAGVLASTLVCSCQATGSSGGQIAAPCDPGQHLLLTTSLSRLAPSQAFVVPPGADPWASTASRPDSEQLFAGVGGVVDVSVAAAGAAPRTTIDDHGRTRTDDPTIDLRRTGVWYRLPVTAGSWRIYTVDLGATAIDVSIIACPHH